MYVFESLFLGLFAEPVFAWAPLRLDAIIRVRSQSHFFSSLSEVSRLVPTTKPVKLSRHRRRNASQPPRFATTIKMAILLTSVARRMTCELTATNFIVLARRCGELS